MKKKFNIKKKFLNHLVLNGEKKTVEKIILKSFKELQKYSGKQSKSLIQLSIASILPIFKIHIKTFKKLKKKPIRETPEFLLDKNIRISLALKFILSAIKKKDLNFHNKLKQEILLSSQLKGDALDIRNAVQAKVLTLNYRWR